MGNFKEELKNVVITEEDRKKLSAEDLKFLERALEELRETDYPDVKLVNPDKFDAKGMKPVNQPGPVRWKLIDDPPKPPKK